MDDIVIGMRKPLPPCRGCAPPKRHIGCHGECGEYADWKAECDAAFEPVKKAKNDEYAWKLYQRRFSK